MHPSRLLLPVVVRASLALAAGLALVLGAAVQPAAATSSARRRWPSASTGSATSPT